MGNLVHSNSWCPECYGNKPLTIEDMRELAASRGGECLSEKYEGNKVNLTWKCADGHEWGAVPGNVKNHGSWCPHCRMNIGEELVRATLEEAFPGHEFDRTRQEPWMDGLELDGYNEELCLAFEYQGKQHYERVEIFQPEEGDFEAQLERDRLTAEKCHEESVTLLVVPFTIKFPNLRPYVRDLLEEIGYEVAPATGTPGEFYNRVRARKTADNAKQLKKAARIAIEKGGLCLSEQYVGYRVPLSFRCKEGHEFMASLEAINQPASRGPRFCTECGGTRRKTDEELKEIVGACGYTFLEVESREEENKTRRYIKVRCPKKHEYFVLWDNFSPTANKPRRGCGECRLDGKRWAMNKWCKKHGIFHGKDYEKTTKECTWACTKGHEFTASYQALAKKGKPCTPCELEEIAKAHGLKLLTPWTKQHKSNTRLTWECLVCRAKFQWSLKFLRTGEATKGPCPNCPRLAPLGFASGPDGE